MSACVDALDYNGATLVFNSNSTLADDLPCTLAVYSNRE